MTAKPFLLAAAFAAFGVHAALAGDCARVNDAWAKKFMTPNKATTVLTMGRVSMTSVSIELKDRAYTKVSADAGWSVAPYDQQKEVAEFRALHADPADMCQFVGSEAVNGEMADMFTVHSASNGGDATDWISQASGLPLKVIGQKVLSDGKTFGVTRLLEYGDIQPPQMDGAAPQQTPGTPP